MKIELKKLIDNLDSEAKSYMEKAVQQTITRGGSEVLIEDMLYAMLLNENSIFNKLLLQYHIDKKSMQEVLENNASSSGRGESINPIFSSSLINWIENTYLINKLELGLEEMSEISLIYSLFENSDRYISTKYFALFSEVSSHEVTTLLKGFLSQIKEKNITLSEPNYTNSEASLKGDLEKFTIDLTQAAEDGKIDPVLSRDDEIRQAIDILSRRRKNNPIMVGEAGVGKTAIVEGLALKIVNKDVPKHLYNTRLLSLDLGALQAGASIKGEFERRLQAVINEIKSSTQPIILFIDEAHTLIGAGGNEGGSDAANLLKPALARGELKTIAATTWLEYRKYFEKDPALSRRFQKIDLHEPSVEQTITILRGISEKYEKVHQVYIEDDALKAAAELSARYITGRQLPDKAIDVLDTACANVKISKSNKPFLLQKMENEILTLEKEKEFLLRDEESGLKDNALQIEEIEKKILNMREELEIETEAWRSQKEMLDQISALKKRGNKEELIDAYNKFKLLQGDTPYIHQNVTENQIAEVISSWTGIPLGNMKKEQAKSVKELSKNLKEHVRGQDEAIDYLCNFLQISTAGLKKDRTPEGVFLLVGPSGVGKTETAIRIAELLFGSKKFLTTINMTEFQEKHTVSRLIGSPPGYVGYGEGGQLTNPVRVKPYSVVLLDEIEKAHQDVLNIFYQIFDKGVVNDGEGREIDFSNTIIIMTSNLCTEEITNLFNNNKNITIEEINEAILPSLSKSLKPALLGRVNVIPYKNLSFEALKEIVNLKLSTIENKMSERGITFKYEEDLLDHIVNLSNTLETGARNLELIINNNLMPKLSNLLLDVMAKEDEIERIEVRLKEDGNICLVTE